MALRRTIALLPSRLPSSSTAATGCGYRRLISDRSSLTQEEINALAKAADATEAAAYAAKAAAAYADAAKKKAADAARKAAADAYAARRAAADANPANKNLKVMISRGVSTLRTDFQRKINAEKIYCNAELSSFEAKFNKAVKDSMHAMKNVENQCSGRSHSLLIGCNVLREKQEIFSGNLDDRVTQAQVSLLKNMAWLASVGAGLVGLYLRAKGGLKEDPKP